MTTDSPKGPESEARPEEPAFELLEQTYELAERQYAEQTAELVADRDRYKAAHESTQRALIRMEAQRDELRHAIARAAGMDPDLSSDVDTDYVGLVSRLREQLATAVVLPTGAKASLMFAIAAVVEEDMDDVGIDYLADKVLDLVRSWGVSSSEVEAPQPQELTQHTVRIEPYRETMWDAYCVTLGCGQHRSGSLKQAQDWKDQHEADTLRPQAGVAGKQLLAERDAPEVFVPKGSEGRPSGSGETAPHWREGDIAIDQSNFVHRRFGHGWRTWPRESGLQYGDALMESGFGPMLRLDEVPAETDAHGHVPVLVAERVRAAQAARSEATSEETPAEVAPRLWTIHAEEPTEEGLLLRANVTVWRRDEDGLWRSPYAWRNGEVVPRNLPSVAEYTWDVLSSGFKVLTEVPSPSLRKEGEDRQPRVFHFGDAVEPRDIDRLRDEEGDVWERRDTGQWHCLDDTACPPLYFQRLLHDFGPLTEVLPSVSSQEEKKEGARK